MVVTSTAAAAAGGAMWDGLSARPGGDGLRTRPTSAVAVVAEVAVVVAVTAGFGGAGFLASSGKSFGASAAHSQSRPMEIRTAAKIRFSMSWDRVPTSRIERMAARQTPHTHPDAAERAIFFDRLHHVDRAGRLEAAHRGQQRRDQPLVETKESQSDRAHQSS